MLELDYKLAVNQLIETIVDYPTLALVFFYFEIFVQIMFCTDLTAKCTKNYLKLVKIQLEQIY